MIKTPLLAVDGVIEVGEDEIVLIERRNYPYGWALPGGFVEIGEDVETAVRREIKEETGLDGEILGLIGVYSNPSRDPRGHVVSIVFALKATGEPKGGDDAKKAQKFKINNLPKLAFDHEQIIKDWIEWKKKKVSFFR